MKTRSVVAGCAIAVSLAVFSGCDSDKTGGSEIGAVEAGGSDSGTGSGGAGAGGELVLGKDDGGSAGGAGGGGMMGPDGSCGQSVVEASVKKASVLLLIDQSGSMVAELGDGDRWKAMRTALTAAIGETRTAVDFGLDLFPSEGCSVPDDPALAVPIEDGETAVPKIVTALSKAGPVENGGTPTAAALARAVAYFEDGAGASLEGDRFVLLASDGGPNCNADHGTCSAAACTVNMEGSCPDGVANCCLGDPSNCLDDDATVAQVEALAKLGVHTFVVGIPGTAAFSDALNAIAVAGGEARAGATKYYAVEDGDALTQTFRDITRTLVKSCNLQLESVPPDVDLLDVQIDGEFIEKEGADGWEIDSSTNPPTVVLKGATCDRVETIGAERVSIVYDCERIR